MSDARGILVMAYGTPRSLDHVEEYYTDIRRGRPPTPELLEELTDRYRAIGGRSPLYEITQAQAKGIEERTGVKTYLGQKHAPPFIPDAVRDMTKDSVEHAVGLVLAPHYSKMSIGDYERRTRLAADELGWTGELTMVRSWHLEEGYIAFLSSRVSTALTSLPEDARAETVVLFTAHSLPERILQAGDPYPDQLRETANEVASRLDLDHFDIAWQSAGRTKDPWIGPDVLDVMRHLNDEGRRGVVVCPCGFVSDHLEVLYDVDIECKDLAGQLGLEFARTESPNTDDLFLDTLSKVVTRAFDRDK
jgi:protoporphyrin/coproporphyrin ferrochelatase